MNFNLHNTSDKETVFKQVAEALKEANFTIVKEDKNRPWGGFYVIDESEAAAFAAKFFPQIEISKIKITNKLSPKFLLVEPHKRLSWQYHHRRAEIWEVLAGPVGVEKSPNDDEGEMQKLATGNFVQIDKEWRHRLIGLESWGIVAEIWQHTDPENPSDEDDIVRVQDDFGR